MDLSALDRVGGPRTHVLVAEPDDAHEQLTEPLRSAGRVVREVRGTKMRAEEGLFDEFAAAWQFPDYFGQNWPAFHECMIELHWLPTDVTGYLVIVRRANQLLAEEDPRMLASVLGMLRRIGDSWATAVHEGEWWDHQARPFHTVLQETHEGSDELLTRMRQLEVQLGEV